MGVPRSMCWVGSKNRCDRGLMVRKKWDGWRGSPWKGLSMMGLREGGVLRDVLAAGLG